MHLQNALRVATLLVLITPCTAYAQDKQHRLEINAGISSPGLHCRADRDIIDFEIPYEYEEDGQIITHNYYSDKQLHDIL